MRASSVLLLAGSIARAAAQDIEPADFDVTQGLLDLGINITEIPQLSDFVERRSLSDIACAAACASLSLTFGRNAVLSRGSTPYNAFTGAYWSANQGQVDPYCIFKPPTATAVSALVLLSRLTQCPFAAKGGGHAAFTGASNIQGGITLSLENFNQVTVSKDKSQVTIGGGLKWADVYSKLAVQDLTVTGGRVSGVGVGGLSLGGGISFFSNTYGWACDNVISYEVVTATGLVITASAKQNPSLYWALRGGGNNFGIVTNFVFKAIPLPGGQMWGGTKTYLEYSFDQVVDAFAGLIADSPKDTNAGVWVAWLKNSGMKLAATELWYGKPDGGSAPIFDKFNAITPIADSTQNRYLPEYTDVQAASNPYGLREVYYGLTVKADPRIATIARDIFFEELPAIEGFASANPVLIFQGITEGQIKHMSANGGNPLGIKPSDGPLYLIHVACWWEDAANDEAIYKTISKILTRINNEAKAIGVKNDYVYMNYASTFQNVIEAYGSANAAKLKSIAKLYDLTGVFQKLQPGHFKLDRAPTPGSGLFSSPAA
ncbi:hypothetical protein F5X68DRAFT_203314 [Plectosphaerella plurivora]|uniref:FAD-binding PCMH-type domain-containing protein n=1 Tax=Plectosphaerella plurivora TaxID=936078 RepID=A0A9P8VHS5_9PEZI|nr:hypothetical protein F5X68DRAFT_203314 [Plectosphaerella plurivora]